MIITKEHYKEYEKKNSFMYHNHIEIVQADKDCSIVKADLKQESMNLNGHVHGGMIYSMADCVAGLTARSGEGDFVTQSSHFNFLSNVTGGTIYAKGEIVRRGRTIVILHITVTDEEGKLLADGVMDMFRIR